MDRTDAEAAPAHQSQSRLPPVLLWVLLAAVRPARGDGGHGSRRGRRAEGSGLVHWQPREKAAALARASRQADPLRLHGRLVRPVQAPRRATGPRPRSPTASTTSFIPARVVDRAREDGSNPADISELQRRFEISGFPTLVVADADGRLIRKSEGYRGRARLIQFLEDAGKRPGGAARSLRTGARRVALLLVVLVLLPIRLGADRDGPVVGWRAARASGPSPNSMRLSSSSQVRRASAQASPRQCNGRVPERLHDRSRAIPGRDGQAHGAVHGARASRRSGSRSRRTARRRSGRSACSGAAGLRRPGPRSARSAAWTSTSPVQSSREIGPFWERATTLPGQAAQADRAVRGRDLERRARAAPR